MASIETKGLDNSPHIRRIIQAVLDLRRGNVNGARVLDLGSAHGLYTLEFARRGANSLGLEGRAAWVEQANAAKQSHDLEKAQFVLGDAREVTLAKHGHFDVILCLGLLYHLSAPEAFALIGNLFEMTGDFLVIDTQIALTPVETRMLGGREYFGHEFPEHPVGASQEAMEAELGASLDSHSSFWFTLPSLLNMLGEAGFTTAFELKWPTEHVYRDGEFRVHEDYVTVVALKGQALSDIFGLQLRTTPLERSPEDRSLFFLQRPWSKTAADEVPIKQNAEANADGGRTPLVKRLAAAYEAFRRP